VDIREIDVADETALHAWWELAHAVDHEDRPWSWFMAWDLLRRVFAAPNHEWKRVVLGGYEGERLVAGGHLQLPLLDNTHVAMLWVFVAPEQRRQSLGTQVLETLTELSVAEGRTTLICAVNQPHAIPQVAGTPFAEHHGYKHALSEGAKLLDIASTRDRWAALAEEAAPHLDGYRLVTWRDRVPDELLDGYCALQAAFNSEAPAGDLDLENEVWDESRVREKEKRFEAVGRHETATAAVAPDGAVAGFTELLVSDASPERAMQGGTIVLPAHRGHRLGIAMKVANQVEMMERFPDVERIVTGNADVNATMNAINDLLGFREVEVAHEMQRKL